MYILFVFSGVMLDIVNNKISCKITNIAKINNVKMEQGLTSVSSTEHTFTETVLPELAETSTVTAGVGVTNSLPDTSIVKRKRGRPRKDEHKKSKCNDQVPILSQLNSQDTSESNGYNLRKVRYKLPPSVIQFERESIKKDIFDISDDFSVLDEGCKHIKTELDVDDESLQCSDTFVNILDDGMLHQKQGTLENEAIHVTNRHTEQYVYASGTNGKINHENHINQADKQNIQRVGKHDKSSVKITLQDHPALKHVPPITRKKRTLSRNAECKYCKRLFCDYTGVDCHVRKYHQHEGDIQDYLTKLKHLKQVSCNYCKDVLADRLAHNIHMSNVHGKSDGILCTCGVCGKSFKNLFRLKIHARQIHAHKKIYHLCHLCPSKFLYVATLKQHIEEIHDQIRNVSCDICKKTFYRTSQLNRHRRIHEDDKEMFVCEECGKKFRFRHNLQRHVQVMHTCKSTQESFHCSYCGHGFRQKSSMVAHVRLTHFSMHTFVCVICKATFQRSRHLSEHMSSVHGDSKFQVDKSRRTNYKYHRTPEDLYYCQFCSSSFFYKAKLVEHMHTAHANAFPHVCKKCNQGFLEKAFLTNHSTKAHGMEEDQLPVQSTENKLSEDVIRLKQLLRLNASETVGSHQSNEHASYSVSQSEQFDPAASKKETKGKTSVIVEVANSCNTVQYVIEGDDEMESEQTAQSVVQDITNLLLVAEQSLQDLASSKQDTLDAVNQSYEQEEQSLGSLIAIGQPIEQDQSKDNVNFVTVGQSIKQGQTLGNVVDLDDSPDVVSEEIIIACSAVEEVEIN